MSLKRSQTKWDTFAAQNSMGAILTSGLELSHEWPEWDEKEFFANGLKEIDELMKYTRSLNISLGSKRALDFGCGIGRLTQGLARYFDQVDGVDISARMLKNAQKYNQHGERCKFSLNETTVLPMFSENTFDFIYSNIVLQHIEPHLTRSYLKEFLRVLSPQGLFVFQIPDHLIDRQMHKQLAKKIIPPIIFDGYRWAKHRIFPLVTKKEIMEMYGIKVGDVIALIEEHGGNIVDVRLDQSETAPKKWVGFRYSVTKR